MNEEKPSFLDKKNLLIMSLGVFFLFSVLSFQFFKIQILEGQKWRSHAGKQHFFDIVEPFRRGTFYSNTFYKKGHPEQPQKLAVDIEKFHLYIDPEEIPNECKGEILARLIAIAHPSDKELNKLSHEFTKESHSRKIISMMDEATKEEVLQFWYPYAKKKKIASNALFVVRDTLRTHPYGKLLGQVLHTVQDKKNEKTLQSFPTGGLELSQDAFLRGRVGKRRLLRSPRHSLETNIVIQRPEDGADIYLTIDHCIQAICEEELEKGVHNAKAKSAWAVMMNPQTGEIVALAQYPFFNPDKCAEYFNNKDAIEDTKVKAITDANEPGSVMKPVTVAIALRANKELIQQGKAPIFSPGEKIDTSHGSFPGRGKALTDTHFHHYCNLYIGMQKSSNIYAATLIHRVVKAMGIDWYRRQLASFGFGEKTGIELPSESAGVLPTPGKKHPNGKLEWSLATPYSLAMGHNIQVTSMQLLRAYTVFANGGHLVHPSLIRKIVKNGEVILDNTNAEAEKNLPQVIPAESISEIIKAMKYITKKGGTAPSANIFGYTEVGKTGTSMKIVNGAYSNKKHVSTFIGFSPINSPAFILLVCVDEPLPFFVAGKGPNQMGGVCCAPIFREIGRRTLEYLGIPPDDPHGYPKGDPRFDAQKADWIPEVEHLQILYQQWNGAHH